MGATFVRKHPKHLDGVESSGILNKVSMMYLKSPAEGRILFAEGEVRSLDHAVLATHQRGPLMASPLQALVRLNGMNFPNGDPTCQNSDRRINSSAP